MSSESIRSCFSWVSFPKIQILLDETTCTLVALEAGLQSSNKKPMYDLVHPPLVGSDRKQGGCGLIPATSITTGALSINNRS